MDVLSTPWADAIRLEMKVAHIIREQELHGFLFDLDKALEHRYTLVEMINKIDGELDPLLPPKRANLNTVEVAAPFKMNGELQQRVVNWFGGRDVQVRGPFSKVDWEPFNLNSDKQLKEFLLSVGWKPDEWNENDEGERTSPKLTESSLALIDHPIGRLISDREMIMHRYGMIMGFMKVVRADGRIPSEINTMGTPTGRGRHKKIVNVPKAGYDKEGNAISFFGNELRSLFCVPEGYRLVGCDAKGLELRMLAHYINDPIFTESILHGDVHQDNYLAMGELCPSRAVGKNVFYGLLYGASDKKLATTAGHVGSEASLRAIGAELRARLVGRLSAFQKLTEGVKEAAKQRGFLYGLDGRKLFIRSPHSALNTLLQAAGAIVMKVAMCYLYNGIKDNNLKSHQCTWQHDEFQLETLEKDVDRVVEICYSSIVKAGEFLKMNVPLEGDVKVGANWQETH